MILPRSVPFRVADNGNLTCDLAPSENSVDKMGAQGILNRLVGFLGGFMGDQTGFKGFIINDSVQLPNFLFRRFGFIFWLISYPLADSGHAHAVLHLKQVGLVEGRTVGVLVFFGGSRSGRALIRLRRRALVSFPLHGNSVFVQPKVV